MTDMYEPTSNAHELWCPCCEKVRPHRDTRGLRHGVQPLRDVFQGLEVEQRHDDPVVRARTVRCACSAEWASVEVPTFFLYQLLEERRLYREARKVAESVLERARTLESRGRTGGRAAGEPPRSLRDTVDEAEALIRSLSARSDNYFLR
jgi:hypothetical protein